MAVPGRKSGATGLLYHAYKGTGAADFGVTKALRRLKRFVSERGVDQPLKDAIRASGAHVVENYAELLEGRTALAESLETLTAAALRPRTVRSQLSEIRKRLAAGHGRRFPGLRTGFDLIDRLTGGLPSVTLLGAPAGTGKTALCLQLATGVLEHHEDNGDVCVVFASLDMHRDVVEARLVSLLAGIDHRTVVTGSASLRGPLDADDDDLRLTPADLERFDVAFAKLDGDLGDRLVIRDRTSFGGDGTVTVDDLRRIVAEAKAETGAKRALLVLDYLQLVDAGAAGQGSDLEADKARILAAQRAVAPPPGMAEWEGDAAILICETRKRLSGTANQEAPLTNDDLMGSSRLVFAAGCVILMCRTPDKALAKVFGIDRSEVAGKKAHLDARRESVLTIAVTKTRNGSTCGTGHALFRHARNKIEPLETAADLPPPDGAVRPAPTPEQRKELAAQQRRERAVEVYLSIPEAERADGVTLSQLADHGMDRGTARKAVKDLAARGEMREVEGKYLLVKPAPDADAADAATAAPADDAA